MQTALKLALLMGLLGFAAACAQQEEVVIVPPVEPEPEFNKF
ncbi:MAG: hypothetical protein AAFR47_12730 [Pseudomonadota bacterium]